MIINVIKKRFSLKIPSNLTSYFQLAKTSKVIEEVFPKKFEKSYKNYFKSSNFLTEINASQNLINSTNQGITAPCWDLLNRDSKKWRYAFGLMVGKFLKIDLEDPISSKKLHEVSALTELLHNGSLIIDDIEDKSEYRRYKKCVHKIYGKLKY